MAISSELIQKLLSLLLEHLNDEKDCQAYLTRALGSSETISQRVVWSTSKHSFVTNMVKELDNFGLISPSQTALCAFLAEISKNVGFDRRDKLDEIIREYKGIHTPPSLLFDLLLDMDFKQQIKTVKQVMRSHRTAGFLVHGEANSGQDVLVTRLFRLTSTWRNNSPINNDVTHNAAYGSVDKLRRQLARSLLLPIDTEMSEIIERICDRWKKKDVIIIFNKVDCVPLLILSQWLQEFWEELVMFANQNLPQEQTHLLMFVVDNCGNISTSNAVQFKHFYQLPPLESFNSDILDDWIDKVMGMQSIQIPAGLNSQVLLERSNGIPGDVYEEICRHCGHEWEGELAKWLLI
jgi:hypothetical protein